VTGRKEGYSNFIDYIKNYIYDYFKNKVIEKMNISKSIVTIINTVTNLSVFTIIEIILKKYGFAYLMNYIFWISIFI
jgi:hypothetical protein